MYDGSDTVILFEELAYQDVLPVAWRPLPDQIDPDLAASYTASNIRVLQACTALQEQGQVEKPDENSPHAQDFLRIEMKRMPDDPPLRGRLYPEAHPAGENVAKVQFENDQLRVARRACAPEIPCDLSAGADTPALLVALTPGHVQAEGSDATALALGQSQWLRPGEKRLVRNKEASPAEFLLFEFKGGR